MLGYDWRQWTRILTIIGTVQYVLLTILAMFFYPGGTAGNHNTAGYSFTENFFSDLGRTLALNGDVNTISMSLFTFALSVSSFLFIPYLITLPGVFTKRDAKIICYISSIIGIFTAICFAGIAFLPWDLYYFEHLGLVGLAFLFIVPEALLLTIAMFIEKRIPRLYAVVFVVFTIILLAYFMIYSSMAEDLVLQAVAQKIVVYSINISFAIQAYGVFRISQRQTPQTTA
ncbi:MAG: hypothetical protein RBG13Loki_3577 [Promethearchaeota archaeon CR_4]|nr:MAG: hypothetical protein RBG13Loki_3577 [Candidatus Lokiarchaeota archaeon CR_4]